MNGVTTTDVFLEETKEKKYSKLREEWEQFKEEFKEEGLGGRLMIYGVATIIACVLLGIVAMYIGILSSDMGWGWKTFWTLVQTIIIAFIVIGIGAKIHDN